MQLIIDHAQPEDAQELTNIMFGAKRYWGYPEEWIQQWVEELTITPEKIDSWDFYAGKIQKEVIFFYSIKQLSPIYFELEDCFVAPKYIGKGYGRILFNDLKIKLKKLNAKSLRILSDPNAEKFYLKMGAKKMGDHLTKIQGRTLPILEFNLKTISTKT